MNRLVEYVLRDGLHAGQTRPALIVYVHGDDVVNLQVFTDGAERGGNDGLPNVMWVEKVEFDGTNKAKGTWHDA